MKLSRAGVALSAAAIIVTGWSIPAWSAAAGQGVAAAAANQLACPSNTTDTYSSTATDAAWGNPKDWSAGRVPTASDVACIPSAYSGPTVVIAGQPWEVGAISVLNPTGVQVNNWGLTIMDKKPISEATNFSVSVVASLKLNGGAFKLLSGQSTISGPFNGPGKLTIKRNATVLGNGGDFGYGLSVTNKGQIQSGTTSTAGGLGLCQDTTTKPATLDNDGTITLYAHGGIGGCDSQTNQGTLVNEAKGKIVTTYPAGFCSCASISSIPTTNDGSISNVQGMALTVPSSLINDGTITSAGELEFSSGNPTLGPSSTIGLVLNSTTSNGYFTEGTGTLTLGGALAISTVSGFTPAIGDKFVLGLDGYYTGTLVGNFNSFSVNGHAGLCIPGDSGVGLVQSFAPDGLWNDAITLTVKSGVAGC